MIALVAAQLYERRRSLLSWGLPLGLWSAFIVSIYPSIQDALAKAVTRLPPGPQGGLRGRQSGDGGAVPARGDVEPDRAAGCRLPRGALDRERAFGGRRERAPRRPALRTGLPPTLGRGRRLARPRSSWPRSWRSRWSSLSSAAAISGAGLSFGLGARRLRQRLASRAAGGRTGRHRDRLLAADERGHRLRCGRACGDVHRGPRRPTRHQSRLDPIRLRVPLLRERD